MTTESRAVPLAVKVILSATAIVLVGLGSSLVVAIHWMSRLYGAVESTAGNNAVRMAGAAIIALGILAWLGRGYDAKTVRKLVLPVMFSWFALKSVVAYLTMADGGFKAPVAQTVLFFDVALTVAYGYFLFVRRREPE